MALGKIASTIYNRLYARSIVTRGRGVGY